ncbi:hypothetical protein Clacol_005604 [Clathrus columnatus]|uniref:FAD-binding FR-type domain-containing protein n=1 Tax=Clathrus columnatus TaxID=1419009 RepID=A0AAV5A9S7_9AGAM|nr:hypothetical protein Clacol_005604 [Clathrus columnatus]
MSFGLKGWHPGEAAIQTQLQYSKAVADAYELFSNALPEEQRSMYSQVMFLPIVTLDPRGRPWVSLLTSPTGDPGFISSPNENTLIVKIKPWQGDPLHQTCLPDNNSSKPLVGGSTLSTNLETLKGPRTKFSGIINEVHKIGTEWLLKFEVTQTLPGYYSQKNSKFMTTRKLMAHKDASPKSCFQKLDLKPSERLPPDLVDFITNTDALYFGTYYAAAKKDEKDFPSHLGFNIRSGIPGFARVRITDGRTITFPDYPGNHLLNSLGNIETTPVAAITIPCYKTGDILYLTGTARNHVGKRAQMLMSRVQVLTAMKVTGYIFLRDAIPLRECQGLTKFSPVCPPLRVLMEEKPIQKSYKSTFAHLVNVSLKSSDLGVFEFKTSSPISINSGDWIRLDFTGVLAGKNQPNIKEEANYFRTWTVTSFSSSATDRFELTIRKRPDGLITRYLFNIAAKMIKSTKSDLKSEDLFVSLPIVASGGDFTLPPQKTDLLWVAGGIGITPFIALFNHVVALTDLPYDIVLVFSTSNPDIHLQLLFQPLKSVVSSYIHHRLTIYLFSETTPTLTEIPPSITLIHHRGRFVPGILGEVNDIKYRDISVCAPPGLSGVVVGNLLDLGILPQSIRQETFNWFF